MGRYHYVFPRWTNAVLPTAIVVGAIAPLYFVYLVAYGFSPKTTDVGYRPIQPVPFSHALHAGELGLDCRYCHNTVERAAKAAIPPTQTCMNCHTQIRKDSEQLAPLWESFRTGTAVEWRRVHDLPDFAFFNHAAHVNRGVGCVECHGRIDRMEVVRQQEPLSMGWCLECHRNPDASIGDPDEVTQLWLRWGEDEATKAEREPLVARAQQLEPVAGLLDMPSLNDQHATGKAYWRSLSELSDTPEFRAFMHREFPAGAADLLDSGERRDFLKVMGASLALAGFGMTGCRRWPDEKIAPYAMRPAGQDPGVAEHFATCLEMDGVASGLLVTSFDGRPIKVDGNPEHPTSLGKTNLFDQATILDLYDPDRSHGVTHDDGNADWDAFVEWAHGHFTGNGAGVAVLCEPTSSPSMLAARERLTGAMPDATWHTWCPINDDNARAGAAAVFGGTAYRPVHRFEQARIIVSLDADFLGNHPGNVPDIRGYAANRRGEAKFQDRSRHYQFEPSVSLTGANADHRVAVRASDVGQITAWLAARILGDPTLAANAGAVASADVLEALEHAVEDLEAHHGEGLLVAGAGQPASVHALVHLMNAALGNAGTTVNYVRTLASQTYVDSLRDLCDAIDAGRVSTLVIIGGNPAYNAPADFDFTSRLGQVESTVHLSDTRNETSIACEWHVNRAHYLETWGDGRAIDGTYTLGQPLIVPLFDGHSAIELLATITGDDVTSGHDLVRRTFAREHGGSFDPATGALSNDRAWRDALHAGFVEGTVTVQGFPDATGDAAVFVATLPDGGGTEVVFRPDPTVYDGRFGNNGWLQELPDPITKLTWDNCVQMAPSAAASMGIDQGDLVSISVGSASQNLPVMLVPGTHPDSMVVTVGYGRTFPGRVSTGAGFDVYPLRTSDAMSFAAAGVSSAGGSYPLATTQDHHAIDTEKVGGQGQQRRLPTIFREADLSEYKDHPDFARHRTHVPNRLSLWNENLPHQVSATGEPTFRWGMSIDLGACTGCNACVVACQAENNIPIVGKDQVMRGREMHWLRIDRYYKFHVTNRDESGKPKAWDPDHVDAVALMPVTCQHCENAPCEQVCPVAATVHDADGLNVMVYNRCVGTRYCSNNCPYKVRRFNYFDYHRREPLRRQSSPLQVQPDYYTKPQSESNPLQHLQFNPEVTVRMRGVMEKCTYCIQRISAARIQAKNEWVKTDTADRSRRVTIPDGSLTTACAQACPADAIIFGDLDDPKSQVRRAHQNDLSYELLEILNVKPRTRYLAKLRNRAFGADSGHGHSDEQPGEGAEHG